MEKAASIRDRSFDAVRLLSRDELVQIWTEAYGRLPPKGVSRRLMVYAAAYHAQAQATGGLTPKIKRILRRASQPQSVPARTPPCADVRPTLQPGSRLFREWRGRSHTVDVTKAGFLYRGHHYRSLSEVARAITGARWSGPRFFGL